MKIFLSALLLILYTSTSSSFVHDPSVHVHPQKLAFTSTSASNVGRPNHKILHMAVELEAEPEGGEEISSISTLEGSKVKCMGESTDVKTNEDGEVVYDFWITASAEGKKIQKLRTQVSKDAAKNANFPGFRKGQIPPYAQPQMTMFAVQEGIINTCEAVVEAYGLKSLKGSDGSVEVRENVEDISKAYNIKKWDDIPFTATFKGTYDEDKRSALTANVEEDAAAADETDDGSEEDNMAVSE